MRDIRGSDIILGREHLMESSIFKIVRVHEQDGKYIVECSLGKHNMLLKEGEGVQLMQKLTPIEKKVVG